MRELIPNADTEKRMKDVERNDTEEFERNYRIFPGFDDAFVPGRL